MNLFPVLAADLRRTDLGGTVECFSFTENPDIDLVTDPQQPDGVAHVHAALHLATVDRQHDIAGFELRLGRRGAGLYCADYGALVLRQRKGLGQLGGQVLNADAQQAAADLAMFDQLDLDLIHHIGRNRETDADVAPGRCQNRGVDADQFTVQVDQRAAGVAGIDRRVGLDEVLVAFDAKPRAAERADDA